MIHDITTDTHPPLPTLHATEADLKGQFDDISAAAQIDKAAMASLMAKWIAQKCMLCFYIFITINIYNMHIYIYAYIHLHLYKYIYIYIHVPNWLDGV